jgi:hypothetical protein
LTGAGRAVNQVCALLSDQPFDIFTCAARWDPEGADHTTSFPPAAPDAELPCQSLRINPPPDGAMHSFCVQPGDHRGLAGSAEPGRFAMLPAYLGLVVIGDDTTRPSRLGAAGRARAATLAMLVVFGAAGIIIVPLMAAAQRYLHAVTVLIGAGLIGLVCGYLSATTSRCSCRARTAMRPTGGWVAAFIAYGMGMTLVVGALAGVEVAMRARRLLSVVGRHSGALLVSVGGYVGYYGQY